MSIDAYILPFPGGVIGFVDANLSRLSVHDNQVTLEVYAPGDATDADHSALRGTFLEAIGAVISSEGAYASLLASRTWWMLGGLISLVLLIMVSIPRGLPTVWITLLVGTLALPGGLGQLLRGFRASRFMRSIARLQRVEIVAGRDRATAERMAALWTVAGRLRGSELDVLDQLESHSLEARWSGPARLYGHYRLWLDGGDSLAPGLPGLWHRWRARLLGGAPPAPIIAVPLLARSSVE